METTSKYPPIIYKYRNWYQDIHKDVLRKNRIFFTSPKDFNDPFDCRIPLNFSLLDNDEKIKSYLDKKIMEHNAQFPEKDISEQIKKFETRLRTELPQIQEHYNSLYFKGVDDHYGVLSLSERWDSILMWSHYGDHHKGYCVGFREEKLRKSLVLAGGSVDYPVQNNFPKISPLNDMDTTTTIKQTHSKSNEWSYEKEFRLVKIFYPNSATIEDRIQKIPDDFFAEILIGLKASSDTKKELLEIAKLKNVSVYQIKAVPFKFEIVKEQIL